MSTTLGFISDVHCDVHALRDALRLLDAMGVTQVICLGDVLDYGIYGQPDVMPSGGESGGLRGR